MRSNVMKVFFKLSLAQKYLMGITGLGLSLFVLLHMLGNLLIFAGPKAYNLYAHKLQNGLLFVFEAGLLFLFFLHIALAVCLSLKNLRARGKGYFFKARGPKATSFWQKSLLAQGAVILVFVILHLITFKFGTHYEAHYEGKTVRDIFRLVEESFQNPMTVIWYILALLVLSVHLFYGLSSSFKSLGLDHPRFTPYIEKAGRLYALCVTAGYLSLPLYLFFFK